MIDSHCHLYFEDFDQDREGVLERARRSGVTAFVNVGVDEPTSRKAIEFCSHHADMYATVGYHPHAAHLANESTFAQIRSIALSSPKVVALGECGIDYVKSEASHEQQQWAFERMAELALETSLPLVVHSRESFKDTLKVLYHAKKKKDAFRAVFHCFSYGKEGASIARDLDLYVSFAGNLTYENSRDMRRAVQEVPVDRLLIETDAPYLAPDFVRGKRNEPSYLNYLAGLIAELRGIAPDDVKKATEENAIRFYGLEETHDAR